ncbi:MAG TPA: HEAT repeat domain-containing protein, partial [Nitrospirae bacterium]|nr:HEAT repeat domain-containing protein [Nitrospirota bacterium]
MNSRMSFLVKIVAVLLTSVLCLPGVGYSAYSYPGENQYRETRFTLDPVLKLIQNLQSEKFGIRRRAVWALGESKDPRAIGPLLEILKDENRSVKVNAIYALGRMGVLAVERLIEALKDEDRVIRTTVAKVFGKMRDPEAVESLIAALEDENPYVRLNAATALGSIKDSRAVEPLITVLN